MNRATPSRISLILGGALCLLAGATAGWLVRAHAPPDRAATEAIVHDYILARPEVLLQAVDNLRAQASAAALTPIRAAVESAWPGAVLGNPHGRVTLVEFSDYACGYCRASLADVAALTAADPDLRVVVRELPILTPESGAAAKMALLAAQQGRFAAFRTAMYAAGRPEPASIAAAAHSAGVVAEADASTKAAIHDELARNIDFARQMGLSGTPMWEVGGRMMTGAVGRDRLAQAVAAARASP